MVVDPKAAAKFIQCYSKLMVTIYELSAKKERLPLIEVIAMARKRYSADQSLLDKALVKLKSRQQTID